METNLFVHVAETHHYYGWLFQILKKKKSVIYEGAELWNQQNPETRNIPTYEAFKEYLKKENRMKLN